MGRGPPEPVRARPGEDGPLSPLAVEGIPHGLLVSEVRDRMSSSVRGEAGMTVGLEVELIPLRAETRLPVRPDDGPAGVGTTTVLRAAASENGWTYASVEGGAGRVDVPGAGWITYEPGGQIELSTKPFAGLGSLTDALERALRPLFGVARRHGVELVTRGLDPWNPSEAAVLSVPSERYRKQAAHYAEIGAWGRRMMLQSAAIHVNVDLGGRPFRRWSVANRAAPFLTAIFANSHRIEGRDAGLRSVRAEQWRHLDPTRTGVPFDPLDPVGAYTAFALEARDFLGPAEGAPRPPFRERWIEGAGVDAWRAHLGTLFPEVRPRGYLEIRSVDALRPAWMPVPALLVAGLLYDGVALEEADALLPETTAELLPMSGCVGLSDARLREGASTLFDIALGGARRLGEDFAPGAVIERGQAFRDRFVGRGLDPGCEGDEVDPFDL